MNWRKQMAKDFSEFREQDGQKMTLRIIPASCLPAMIKAGDEGDPLAREMFWTITNWMETADKALDDGTCPACGYCEEELHQGEVWGWAVLTPERDGIGMVAAYCRDCMTRNPEELMRDFMADLETETGVVAALLQ